MIPWINNNVEGLVNIQLHGEFLRNFFYPLRQQSGFGEGYLPEILALGNSRSLKDEEAFIVKAPQKFCISPTVIIGKADLMIFMKTDYGRVKKQRSSIMLQLRLFLIPHNQHQLAYLALLIKLPTRNHIHPSNCV